MKPISFKKFLAEDDSYALVKTGIDSKSIDNKITRTTINSGLGKAMISDFLTPYIALGSAARVLAYAGIILPQYTFLDKESGEVVFDAHQWGSGVRGVDDQGNEIKHKESDNYYVYFTYDMDASGYYDCFCAVLDAIELESILDADDEHDDSFSDAIENGPMQSHEKVERDGPPANIKEETDKKIPGMKLRDIRWLPKKKPFAHGKECPSCDGMGDVKGASCTDCKGKGKILEEPLQELSAKTLSSYVNKAVRGTEYETPKIFERRAKGVSLATKKLGDKVKATG